MLFLQGIFSTSLSSSTVIEKVDDVVPDVIVTFSGTVISEVSSEFKLTIKSVSGALNTRTKPLSVNSPSPSRTVSGIVSNN